MYMVLVVTNFFALSSTLNEIEQRKFAVSSVDVFRYFMVMDSDIN